MSESVLVVAAHPDDEALGCAGTLYKHIEKGDRVSVLWMADGVSARSDAIKSDHVVREKSVDKAVLFFPWHKHKRCDFDDNAMDKAPFIEVVREVEKIMALVSPTIIYTHYENDLNIDHRICYQAVMTASRPVPGNSIKEIYSFEVLSSTEWCAVSGESFKPNYFVDIESHLSQKMEYLHCYDDEMRDFPHTRSYDSVRALAQYRGSSVGLSAAEAFVVNRIIGF